ncbi:MAG: hypothetical protein JRF47_03160 [Deltaproteobacteria bacterium]|jgi:hypothetical protein|nr:hypothetical protein [Deltaproteobacteria bacterium]
MLKDAISKTRQALKEAQQKYSVESAAAIEQVYGDIKNLNTFINKEVDIINNDKALNDRTKSNERRKVLEQAGRKLEILREKRTKSALIEDLETKLADESGVEDESALKFLREREVRDRLYGMPAAQILSHFGKSLFDGSNRLVLDAILNAPAGFEMLPEDTLQKLREVRTQILKPEIAAELDTTRKLNTLMEQIFWLVKKEIDGMRRKELPTSLIIKK